MCSAPPLHLDPDRGRRADTPYSGDPQGVEPSCMRLYIGRRHFVPQPMPMERASYGCRREPEGESRGGRGRAGGMASDLSDSSDRVQPYPRATAQKKAPHPVSRQSGEPPSRCLGKSFVVAHRYPFPEASHRIEPPPHPEGVGIPAALPRDAFSARGSEERSGWGLPV